MSLFWFTIHAYPGIQWRSRLVYVYWGIWHMVFIFTAALILLVLPWVRQKRTRWTFCSSINSATTWCSACWCSVSQTTVDWKSGSGSSGWRGSKSASIVMPPSSPGKRAEVREQMFPYLWVKVGILLIFNSSKKRTNVGWKGFILRDFHR